MTNIGRFHVFDQHLAKLEELFLPDSFFIDPEVEFAARADCGHHGNRPGPPGGADDRGLPDRRPGGPGVVVGPDAGLICEEDGGTLLLGPRLDLRGNVSCFHVRTFSGSCS